MQDVTLNPLTGNVSTVSHDSIRAHLSRAIGAEHEATADLLRYLGEYEHRQRHLRDGYSSIYVFLTRGHGYSEGAAARRSTVARFSRNYPEVLGLIAAGDLSLSVADLVARAFSKQELTADQIPQVLTQLKRKSKTEAEILLAESCSTGAKAHYRERIRAVAITTAPSKIATNAAAEKSTGFDFDHFNADPSEELNYADETVSKNDSADHIAGSTNKQLIPSQEISTEFQISMRLSKEAMDQLKRAQELLRTKDLASTIEKLASFHNDRKDPLKNPKQPKSRKATPPPPAAVTVQNKSTSKAKSAQSKPETASHPRRSRYVADSTRRAVFLYSGGQCCYVDYTTGRRCEERRHLEVDHIHPYAQGGGHSPENLQILCRAHNMMRARDHFGSRFIASKIEAGRS